METKRPDRLSKLRKVLSNQAVSMLLILILLWFSLSLLSPYFFTVGNLSEITLQTAVIGIIAAGQTLVILSGGIDLSVGSVFASSGVAGGLVFQATGNLWLTLATTLLTAAALGLLNGLFITKLRVPPFIATLGMLGMGRGLALILSRGIPIFGLSKEFLWIGQGKLFDLVPVPTVILLAVYAVVYFVARYTRFGRFIYATGSNTEAAQLSGISIGGVILGTYALSGLFCGVAAVIEAARLGTVQPAGGNGYELLAIGAVVIGGTSLFGGEGNVIATLIGALLETTIRNGLNLLGVNAFWQYVVNGAVIIAAVTVDQWRRRI
jgi:ribose transport system permease protein